MAQGQLPPIEYKVFKEYYGHLKNILSAQNLSQYLVSADVITFQDEEEICAAKTSSAKATILLQKLVGPLEMGNTFGFYKLLQKMEVHGNMATKDLASKMKTQVSSLQKGPPVGREPTQNASQPATVSHQTSSIPQEANTVSSVPTTSNPNAAIDNSESYEIVDLQVPSLKWMHKIVVPNISFCWKKVADFLEYAIPKKKEIEERQRGDPTKCCVELLEDWLSTDNGVKPKTWSKLLSLLKEITELKNISLTIERQLLEENVICKK